MFQRNNKLAIFFASVSLFALPFQLLAQKVNQSSNARNTVFIEIGGNAGQYAFNYGRIFYQKEAFKLTATSGFSLWAEKIDGSTVWNPALPLELTSLLGRNRHHLELGFGITPFLEAEIISSFEPQFGEDIFSLIRQFINFIVEVSCILRPFIVFVLTLLRLIFN